MVSVSKVTAPFCAHSKPATLTLLPTVMELRAKTLPLMTELAERVAEEPTRKYTLHACTPAPRTTLAPIPVTKVVPMRKMNWSEVLVAVARLRVRTVPAAIVALVAISYTPGVFTVPPSVPAVDIPAGSPIPLLYVAMQSVRHLADFTVLVSIPPEHVGPPVMAPAGETPHTPVMDVAPELVMPEFPITPKFAQVPRHKAVDCLV